MATTITNFHGIPMNPMNKPASIEIETSLTNGYVTHAAYLVVGGKREIASLDYDTEAEATEAAKATAKRRGLTVR